MPMLDNMQIAMHVSKAIS